MLPFFWNVCINYALLNCKNKIQILKKNLRAILTLHLWKVLKPFGRARKSSILKAGHNPSVLYDWSTRKGLLDSPNATGKSMQMKWPSRFTKPIKTSLVHRGKGKWGRSIQRCHSSVSFDLHGFPLLFKS